MNVTVNIAFIYLVVIGVNLGFVTSSESLEFSISILAWKEQTKELARTESFYCNNSYIINITRNGSYLIRLQYVVLLQNGWPSFAVSMTSLCCVSSSRPFFFTSLLPLCGSRVRVYEHDITVMSHLKLRRIKLEFCIPPLVKFIFAVLKH